MHSFARFHGATRNHDIRNIIHIQALISTPYFKHQVIRLSRKLSVYAITSVECVQKVSWKNFRKKIAWFIFNLREFWLKLFSFFSHFLWIAPVGVVTFTRRAVPESDLPEWDDCQKTFADSMLYVSDDGTIEDDGSGLLQVDFANKVRLTWIYCSIFYIVTMEHSIYSS